MIKRIDSLRFIKSFTKKSIKIKIILIFVFVSIIPIFILQASTHSYLYSSMKDKISQISRENLQQAEKNVDMVISFYEDMLMQISTDINIIEQTRKMNTGADQERYLATQQLQTKIVSLVYSRDYIKSIAIIGCSGNYTVFNKDIISSGNHIWSSYPDIRKASIYSDAMKNRQLIIENAVFHDTENKKNDYLIHLSMRLCDLTNINSDVGVAVMSINEYALSDACNYVSTVNNNGGATNFTFIVNNNGSIVSYPVKEHIGNFINIDSLNKNKRIDTYRTFINSTSVLKAKNMIINEISQPLTGWTIVNVVDQDYLFKDTTKFQGISLALGILIAVFSILIILYVLRTITRSIKKITNTMKVVQSGELLAQVKIDTKDEISIIGDNFNLMMNKINTLISELKHQMELTFEASDRQRKAEIMALEAQINPHFLYNTLDSINWMAIEKREYEISNMLKSLAQILRYSISKSNSMVEVSEEVEWLRQYIYLQKTRFDNSFECQIDVEESITHNKIYKLILQPFIENAIIHGFEKIDSGGLLTISITPDHDRICIIIEDNGCGIHKDQIEIINKFIAGGMSEGANSKAAGIGITNALSRIKMYYGDSINVHIDNKEPHGTRVSIIIP